MTNHNNLSISKEQASSWQRAIEWGRDLLRKTRTRTIGAVAVGAVTIPMFAGCATPSAEGNVDDAPKTDPKTPVNVEKTPQATETPKSFEEQVGELKIEAGLSAEEYAKVFNERIDEWAFAGATDENHELWMDTSVKFKPDPNFEDAVAAEQAPLYVAALFMPGYETEQSLINAEKNLTTRNAAWLALWLRSYDYKKGGTLEAHSITTEAKVLSENPETGERVIYMAGYETSNANEANFANPENRKKAEVNGRAWDDTLTLKTIDGYEYVSKWEG